MEKGESAQPPGRLVNFLIAKSIIEALFVGALAVGFYLTAFHPYFRGWVDEANARQVHGWAFDSSSPYTRVEVQLYVDGRFVGHRTANLSRPDVKAAGRAADEWIGFVFDVPALDAGEHEARVYAVHESGGGVRRTLQLIGKPLRFSIDTRAAQTSPDAAK
jgi:hypothetical protein